MSPTRAAAVVLLALLAAAVAPVPAAAAGADLGSVSRYGVLEVRFAGPARGPADAPARADELRVTFRHESGTPEVELRGFWDGDGAGGASGNVFAVRFCPTEPGRWAITRTTSNRPELDGQRVGDTLVCTPSKHPGFWVPDGRWYKRSDGSHPFVVGNTHYSFLSRRNHEGPVATDPVSDVRKNAAYFSKLRFTLMSDRYPDPDDKPFLDDAGKPTDDGAHSFRPNPQWFRLRADPVIAEAHRVDLACDLILCGPDTRESRSTLRDEDGGARAWLSYVAARYGSYPNVWFCLSNEYDIRDPAYTPAQMVRAGEHLRAALAYPSPVSVHRDAGDWDAALNGAWHDHVIFQAKIPRLDEAADAAARNSAVGGDKPVVNDENAYQGAGDGFSEADAVEGCLGTFLGGAYATTGEKHGDKLGQYFWGGFDENAHTAARGLGHLRDYVNRAVPFWTMRPLPLAETPFAQMKVRARVLGRAGEEYVLGTSGGGEHRVELPPGTWKVVRVDLMDRRTETLAESAQGSFQFTTPDSRAVLTHFANGDEDP